jgi:hypothetical protein
MLVKVIDPRGYAHNSPHTRNSGSRLISPHHTRNSESYPTNGESFTSNLIRTYYEFNRTIVHLQWWGSENN